jgi:hypothetical protein
MRLPRNAPGSVLVIALLVAMSPATRALAEPGGSGDLVRTLSSMDPAERARAAMALGELGDAAAAPALIRSLRSDPVAEVRGWALRALARIGGTDANEAISAAASNDADDRVRALAAGVLGIPTPPAPPVPVALSPRAAAPRRDALVSRTAARTRDPGRELRAGGWATMGGTYMMSLLAAVFVASYGRAEESWPLFLPIVGPAIFGSLEIADGETMVGLLSWVDSLAQVAGFVLALVGHAQGSRARRERERARAGRRVELIAAGPGGSGGLTLSARF